MANDSHHVNSNGHGDYERRDIGVAGVLYFLLALVVAGVMIHFIVQGVFWYLNQRSEAEQAPVSPLVTSTANDTRHLPKDYKTDSNSADYEKYLEKNFPQPQLETNERTELNKIRLREENILSTYDYVDKNAGTVRIPIDRAMDLLAQRGLPVRSQAQASSETARAGSQKKEKK